MAIEIVDFPIKNGDCPVRYVKLPEGKHLWGQLMAQGQTSTSPDGGGMGPHSSHVAWHSLTMAHLLL